MCIAESHLLNNHLNLENYVFYGNCRKLLHVNAKNGSGGVGIFIKKESLSHFNVSILDNSYEGFLWLSLTDKVSKNTFNICSAYLPPYGSSR